MINFECIQLFYLRNYLRSSIILLLKIVHNSLSQNMKYRLTYFRITEKAYLWWYDLCQLMIYEIIYKTPYFSIRQHSLLDDNELNKEVNTVYLSIANYQGGGKGKGQEEGTRKILWNSFFHLFLQLYIQQN